MSVVAFSVSVPMRAPAHRVWEALVDWESHGKWIPATQSRVLEGDGGLGSLFVAISGYGPLALVDRMRVIDFDAAAMLAEVEKVGPFLGGTAGFTVRATGNEGCSVDWHERVTVPMLPRFIAPVLAVIGARAFAWSLRRLQRQLG